MLGDDDEGSGAGQTHRGGGYSIRFESIVWRFIKSQS